MNHELDMNELNELTDGDEAILKELLDSFFECADDCIAGLSENLHDSPAWKEHAHALKGISLNFGAVKLADVSRIAENKPDLTLQERQELLKNIKECYKNIRKYCSEL